MSEVALLAQNLARNCGYAVFPVGADKHPRTPNGFKGATREPDRISELWDRYPGELIGIATGEASGISVLDVDQKHAEAVVWWEDNHHRLLPTRAYESRSGGVHLYFHHTEGVTCTAGRICNGIDTRGEGGYVIAWFAAGLPCHDHTPPAPWPPWLLDALSPPPLPELYHAHVAPAEAAIAGIVRRVADAVEGERNAVLFWAACRLAGRGMQHTEIEALLAPVVCGRDFSLLEAQRTIQSATRRAAA